MNRISNTLPKENSNPPLGFLSLSTEVGGQAKVLANTNFCGSTNTTMDRARDEQMFNLNAESPENRVFCFFH